MTIIRASKEKSAATGFTFPDFCLISIAVKRDDFLLDGFLQFFVIYLSFKALYLMQFFCFLLIRMLPNTVSNILNRLQPPIKSRKELRVIIRSKAILQMIFM